MPDFATIFYTIAASAYGVLMISNEDDKQCLNQFFDYFSKYVERIKASDKHSLYSKNTETLLENALDLLILFNPTELAEQAQYRVTQVIDAWDDRLALSVLLKMVFEQRMDFQHKDSMVYTQTLAELYLKLAEKYDGRYRTERATVMNILSDLTYFAGKEDSEDEALNWIVKSLELNPGDEFAKQRKKNIQDSLVTKEQIRRFNHDANNEIGGLTSNLKALQRLLESATIDPECLAYLQKINNGMQRMAAVRRSVQKQQPDFKSIDIYHIIKSLAEDYEKRIYNIPVFPEMSVYWDVDEDYFRLALNNLIKNCAEAFERKQIDFLQRKLEIRLEPVADHLRISIRDNAGGIDEKFRERIFEPYISSKGVQKNTGLGLSNARSEIELMEGTLQLASVQPENSTEFIINLPK